MELNITQIFTLELFLEIDRCIDRYIDIYRYIDRYKYIDI